MITMLSAHASTSMSSLLEARSAILVDQGAPLENAVEAPRHLQNATYRWRAPKSSLSMECKIWSIEISIVS
jgi:hypothetical protein